MQTHACVCALRIMWRMNDTRDMLCVITSQFVLFVAVQFWQGSTEHRKDPRFSHFHCFCITHHCNNDAAMPASPSLIAMAPPLQRPLSALIITLLATAVRRSNPGQQCLHQAVCDQHVAAVGGSCVRYP